MFARFFGGGKAPRGNSAVDVYYSPAADLEKVDISILAAAPKNSKINVASFVLSNRKIVEALAERAAAGCTLRIYLDPGELKQLALTADHPLVVLSHAKRVTIRVKAAHTPLMHLKGYSIGGSVLRSGSANISIDGLRHQDNDIVLIKDAAAAAKFDANFEKIWVRADNWVFQGIYAAAA